MNEVDLWSAEKCGIFIGNGCFEYDNEHDGSTVIESEWTLTDARCREIVREVLRIHTYETVGNRKAWTAAHGIFRGRGEWIEEAEINCIQEMMQSDRILREKENA